MPVKAGIFWSTQIPAHLQLIITANRNSAVSAPGQPVFPHEVSEMLASGMIWQRVTAFPVNHGPDGRTDGLGQLTARHAQGKSDFAHGHAESLHHLTESPQVPVDISNIVLDREC